MISLLLSTTPLLHEAHGVVPICRRRAVCITHRKDGYQTLLLGRCEVGERRHVSQYTPERAHPRLPPPPVVLGDTTPFVWRSNLGSRRHSDVPCWSRGAGLANNCDPLVRKSDILVLHGGFATPGACFTSLTSDARFAHHLHILVHSRPGKASTQQRIHTLVA